MKMQLKFIEIRLLKAWGYKDKLFNQTPIMTKGVNSIVW